MDLALTKGMGNPFDILTLERIAKQTEQFSKYSVLMRLMKEMKYYKYALSESWA